MTVPTPPPSVRAAGAAPSPRELPVHAEVVVLGGGIAGATAATEAARLGRRVVLVAAEPVGGRGGWSSLLPSKVLIHAAEEQAAAGAPPPRDVRALAARMRAVGERFNGQLERSLHEAGVTVVRAAAAFGDARTLLLHDVGGADGAGEAHALRFDAAVVATGSVPVFPPALAPDGAKVIAPRAVPHLTELPESMLVVGGGVTGAEFTHAFSALGVRVTWLVDEYGVLPGFDRALAHRVAAALEGRGVELVAGSAVRTLDRDGDGVTAHLADGRSARAARAFVAVGRRADLDRLQPERAGIELRGAAPFRAIAVDAYARTSVPHVFAAGDATGAPLTATKALAEAWTAGRLAGGGDAPPLDPASWIHAVYTQPQAAQVGLTPERAGADGRAVIVRVVPAAASLRHHLLAHPDADGAATSAAGRDGPMLQLVLDARSRVVVGACAVGADAAEQLASVALAIRLRATDEQLAPVVGAYPTLSELPFIAARATAHARG